MKSSGLYSVLYVRETKIEFYLLPVGNSDAFYFNINSCRPLSKISLFWVVISKLLNQQFSVYRPDLDSRLTRLLFLSPFFTWKYPDTSGIAPPQNSALFKLFIHIWKWKQLQSCMCFKSKLTAYYGKTEHTTLLFVVLFQMYDWASFHNISFPVFLFPFGRFCSISCSLVSLAHNRRPEKNKFQMFFSFLTLSAPLAVNLVEPQIRLILSFCKGYVRSNHF